MYRSVFSPVAAIFMAALVAGCSGVGSKSSSEAISSKPPASAVVLTAPAIVNDQGTTTTFPAGEYRPVEHDRGGYYFKAPEKVIVDEVAVYAFEGGLYVAHGSTEPARWYVIHGQGKKMGRFKKIPPHTLVP